MKKILVLLVTIMLVFTGCSNDSGAENNNDLTGGTAGIPRDAFIGISWGRPIEGYYENLYFSEDNTFHYSEDCGNPVDDADLYEEYSYDDEAGIIIVTSPYGEEDMIIKMISCEDEKLVLDFNGEERVFELEEE